MAMDCMAVGLVNQGLRTKCHDLLGSHSVVIKLLGERRLKAFLLALFVVSIPWLGSIVRGGSMVHNQGHNIVEFENVDPIKLELFPVLLQDLINEGLLRLQDKGLIVNERLVDYDSLHTLLDNKMDLIPYSDVKRKGSVLERNYDFAFTSKDIDVIDKVLKVKGIMVAQIKGNHPRASDSFQKPSNYEIVYQRKFESRLNVTIIGMRKMSLVGDNNNNVINTIPHRRLFGVPSKPKKVEALNKLEDVLLEPASVASGKSSARYLPDLMEDSLENYPRRVFIDVNGDIDWFTKNYPTRNKNFEIYHVETTVAKTNDVEGGSETSTVETEISNWLKENVKREEYVVMRAEAEVVEELVNNKAIGLVDELFLECEHQGVKGKRCKRPYWRCLTLYGLLRDEGIAVHQWWG